MKTIKEAGKERGIIDADNFPHYSLRAEMTKSEIAEWFCDTFKAGVEFAERWIPIEEELPEKKEHGFSDKVLTKDKIGNIKIERYDYEYNHFNEIRYDSIKTGDGQVTHWRPINHK